MKEIEDRVVLNPRNAFLAKNSSPIFPKYFVVGGTRTDGPPTTGSTHPHCVRQRR